MQRMLTPLCLVLSLALLVTAFALLATDAPEPGINLHRATAMGDDAYREVLEQDLHKRIWIRRGLIGALFVAAIALGIGAFFVVAGSDP